MAVKWTEEQQRVIDTRDKNILVSAAAGSGKTAVLVARILAIITDEKKPVDIDRLLVLTFTNAAAAEMRERVRDALEARAEEEPDNVHLQRQLVLVHNAKITTIHSFCLNVLRNHFQTVGIDPSFRVADEGEILLLEQEAVKETVEAAYQEGDAEFLAFLETAATGKNDSIIEEMILQLYHFAQGQPWPKEWLQGCRKMYGPETEVSETVKEDAADWGGHVHPIWLQYIEEEMKHHLWDLEEKIREALRVTEEPDGPYMYASALESDLEILDQLQKAGDYEGYAEAFRSIGTHAVLSRKKDESVSADKREQVKQLRQEVKDGLAELRKKYFYDKVEVLQKEFEATGVSVRALTKLTEQFMECFSRKKTEKNILDFGDLEHLALQILMEKSEEGESFSHETHTENRVSYHPTPAALEYAETFEEIMTDEYQDSNLVQELILNSVSGRGKGEPNRFMVGDVKQSIYRFRLARPELFMEKYKTYQADGESACRIDLHKNFRSRAQVLEGVNDIFRQIMTENLGGIVYDKDAALYPGAVFSELEPSEDALEELHTTELWLLESDAQIRQKNEALLVGQRIQKLVGNMPVWDKEEACYRPAKYSDMVILLRTVSGWAEAFGETLSDMGIPCFTGSQKGYFSTTEIRTVLSYLQILDNPVQDIPFAAVLRSAIGKITDEELAKIRSASRQRYFYDCVQEYRINGEEELLKRKLEQFFDVFDYFRAKCGHTPVYELLWEMLERTGYGEYASSLPGGPQRKANLDMLVEKAIAYERTSYRGLYHFVRYIENLKKYEVDYGEANIGSEADNTVRIMSIHKSKGLEFPIVFVSGMGKQFNESDARSKVVTHPEFGIGCDYVDTKLRTRQATLLKKVIQQKTISENLGEELRVLYVAMTRAREKLILTGTTGDLEAQLTKWRGAAKTKSETLSYSWLSSASSYLDWTVPALMRHPDAGILWGENSFESSRSHFGFFLVHAEKLFLQSIKEETKETVRLQQLLQYDGKGCKDEEARNYLERVFASVYPHEKDKEIIGKLSVSELKKLSHMSEEETMEELYQPETVVPLIPQFLEKNEAISGAARGTVYHEFMENLDFSKKDELERQLEELISCGKMSREEGEALNLADIRRFLESPCGRQMEKAALAGMLYRERPFVIGVPADEIRRHWNPEEMVLIQGIIDAYFKEEDGTISIVDYKTDRVPYPMMLVQRYRAQLDYYALALERLTGCKVKERIIYSFHFGREIRLTDDKICLNG